MGEGKGIVAAVRGGEGSGVAVKDGVGRVTRGGERRSQRGNNNVGGKKEGGSWQKGGLAGRAQWTRRTLPG